MNKGTNRPITKTDLEDIGFVLFERDETFLEHVGSESELGRILERIDRNVFGGKYKKEADDYEQQHIDDLEHVHYIRNGGR